MNQTQIKFGLTCGIVGILWVSCSQLVAAMPPLPTTNPPAIHAQAKVKPQIRGQKLPETAQFKTRGQTILLEVARTPEEQSIGLMYRTELPKDRGMLFVFSPPRPVKFWMKNTLIPLDMLFMSNGVVKYIGTAIPPCKADPCPSYGSATKIDIDRVIELPSGRAAALRIEIGDRLNLQSIQPNGLNIDRSR